MLISGQQRPSRAITEAFRGNQGQSGLPEHLVTQRRGGDVEGDLHVIERLREPSARYSARWRGAVRQCGPIHAGMHLPADEHRAAVVEPQPRERCPYLMRDAIIGHQM